VSHKPLPCPRYMRAIIRSNPLRIAVLVWFAGWLVLVMPGHKRGIVEVPGGDAQEVASSCCEPQPSCCDAADGSQTTPRPTDPAKHCAICFLKAHLTNPPPVTLYTPYLGELDELAFAIESSIADAQAAPSRVRGRAPPA